VRNIVLIPSRAIISLAQPFDLALQGIEPARDVSTHILDDARVRGDIRTIQRPIPPMPGRDAALRCKQISAARILVPPDNGLLESRHGRSGEYQKSDAAPSGRSVHGETSGIAPDLSGNAGSMVRVPESLPATFRQFDFPPGLEDITRFDGPVPVGNPLGTKDCPPPE
jgi:hypothetical protein